MGVRKTLADDVTFRLFDMVGSMQLLLVLKGKVNSAAGGESQNRVCVHAGMGLSDLHCGGTLYGRQCYFCAHVLGHCGASPDSHSRHTCAHAATRTIVSCNP